MKQVLQLSTKQSLKMTPQLQQAIKLLQLSSTELEDEIKNALELNPMLEPVDPQEAHASDLPVETEWGSVESEFSFQHDHAIDDDFSSFTTSELTLQDHLLWQLNLTPFSDKDRIIAINIIDSLDDTGYLITPLEEIQTSLIQNYPNDFAQTDLDEVVAVLHRIQQFDPIGVACRDLQECMLIQLNAMPTTTPFLSVCKDLVTNYLDLLANKNYMQIKQKLQLKDPELQTVIHTLTRLHPRPGELVNTQKSEYIIPDVLVSKKNNRWVVELNHDLAANVRINPSYAALIKRADSSRDNQFLREQLNEAKWFLNSLRNRNETLLKVASCIVTQQREFLEHGEEKMQPLTLNEVAIAIGLNESTVSRVTTKKYLHTPRGVYELKYFFSSHVSNSDGDNCSSTAIKAIIKKLIGGEEPKNPLSDQAITALMLDQGIKLSRRTVAKYRESMGIQSSNQRKK